MVVKTFRYFWQDNNKQLFVRYVTGSEEEHKAFIQTLNEREDITSVMREYQGEVNLALIGFTETIKKEEKTENEEIQ